MRMKRNEEFDMTHKEVAEVMSVARQTVNHIEKRALEKFKEELKKRGIESFDILPD